MKYKVIKDFGSARKGDVLVEDEDGLLSFFIEDKGITRVMSMDCETAEEFASEGKLEEIVEPTSDDKIEAAIELIDILLEKYESDYADVMDKYNEGKVQPCVKVEAETVYFNLTKVLNKVKELLINE